MIIVKSLKPEGLQDRQKGWVPGTLSLFFMLISLSDLLSGLSNWNNQRRLLTNYQVTSEVKTGQVKMRKRMLTCLMVLPETMKMKHRWVFFFFFIAGYF